MYSYFSIEYDPKKDRANIREHQVSLAEAEAVLSDHWGRTVEDPDARGEGRWITVGLDAQGRLLIVVHTERNGRARVISVRKASPNEGRIYDERRVRFQ